ncbi:MAG TPA: oligosaccharide MFS transporter [Steroidobacteraceae bacterium]|nr:oligosaccharide MFS transporter [Steroidobacteraceae bacterium]
MRRRNYALLSGFLFFYFLAQGATISLLSIWYSKALGLSSTEIGFVFSANFVGAMISQPIYGFVSDKIGLRKHLLWGIAVLCMSCGVFFKYAYAPLLQSHLFLGACLGGLYLGITFLAGSYAIESYVDRVGRKYGFEYGRARLWGSLGFACAAFVSGHLYNIDAFLNYALASLAGVMLVPVLLASRIEPSQDEKQEAAALKMRDSFAILRMREFWGFMVLILGVTNLYLVYDQQFPRYFASLFSDPEVGRTMFGYLSSAQIFVEAGMLFVAPWIVRFTGAKRGLLLAASIMIVRIAGSGIAEGPISISCMKMLHSLELPILIVSVFKYIALHFEGRFSSTVYMVGFSFGHSLGLAVLSPLAGRSYDFLGFQDTYLSIAGLALLFLLWSWFSLTPDAAAGRAAATSGPIPLNSTRLRSEP